MCNCHCRSFTNNCTRYNNRIHQYDRLRAFVFYNSLKGTDIPVKLDINFCSNNSARIIVRIIMIVSTNIYFNYRSNFNDLYVEYFIYMRVMRMNISYIRIMIYIYMLNICSYNVSLVFFFFHTRDASRKSVNITVFTSVQSWKQQPLTIPIVPPRRFLPFVFFFDATGTASRWRSETNPIDPPIRGRYMILPNCIHNILSTLLRAPYHFQLESSHLTFSLLKIYIYIRVTGQNSCNVAPWITRFEWKEKSWRVKLQFWEIFNFKHTRW